LAGILGPLRSRVLTPSVSETTLAKRGFHVKNPASQQLLEHVGRTFLLGFSLAVSAARPAAVQPGLDELPTRFRGFAYEGAAMGFVVADAPAGPLHWLPRRDR
jgi:hypothetical protein